MPCNRHPRRGAAMVEFTLSFIAILIVFMALVELGRAVWTFTTLSHATFEGARFASVHGADNPVIDNGEDETPAAIEDVVRNNAIGLDAEQIQILTSYSPDNNPGGEFTVAASYGMPTILGRFFFASGSLPISTKTVGVVLQ